MGSWFVQKWIKNVVTRQHASIAERAIRTIKKRLNDKLESDNKFPDLDPKSYLANHYREVVKWSGEQHVQRTIIMTPDDAGRDQYEFDFKTNLETDAVHRRTYPEIAAGDGARSFRKKKVREKERIGELRRRM